MLICMPHPLYARASIEIIYTATKGDDPLLQRITDERLMSFSAPVY